MENLTEGMKKRIVIVDDHASIRDMLAGILRKDDDYEVVGEAGTGVSALEVCANLHPDLVILDLMLPEMSGTEVIRRMQEMQPMPRLLVYSGTFNKSLVNEALRCMPNGYVSKSEPLASLKEAISVITSGGNYFNEYASDFLKSTLSGGERRADLTDREREILKLVAGGMSSKDIARMLGLAIKTVENHRAHLMQKLGVHDVASLTRYAISHGIVPSE